MADAARTPRRKKRTATAKPRELVAPVVQLVVAVLNILQRFHTGC